MLRWNYKELDYDSIKVENIKDNKFLFDVLCVASFIEITSDVYERNLSKFYAGDKALTDWLENDWEEEEVQHGKSLKAYIKQVWKDFDWDKAYKNFTQEYLPLCNMDNFQDSKAKEMIARMVVETGTSTFYKGLAKYSQDLDEPLLGVIATNISKDEIYHYEEFEKAFKKYNEEEKLSKTDIIKILYSRLKEVNDEDVEIAYKNIEEKNDYEAFHKTVKKFAKQYYPYNMAVKMLMKPLKLGNFIESVTASTAHQALKIIGI